MEKCFITGLTCPKIECDLYHEATQICKIVMLVNRTLGHIDGPAPKETPTVPIQTPVVDGIKPDNPFPELVPDKFLKSIAGRIKTDIEIREVETSRGPVGIANFMLTDGAIEVRVAVWEPDDKLKGFNVGAWITLTNMSVKDPYEGVAQISTTRNSKISR